MSEGMFDIIWLLDSGGELYLKVLICIVVCKYLSKPKGVDDD